MNRSKILLVCACMTHIRSAVKARIYGHFPAGWEKVYSSFFPHFDYHHCKLFKNHSKNGPTPEKVTANSKLHLNPLGVRGGSSPVGEVFRSNFQQRVNICFAF